MTPKLIFRIVAIAEAITWTGLIAALISRAVAGPDFLTIAGSLHGFVFLSYAGISLLVGIDRRWKTGIVVLAVVSAIVPYATIPVELWLARRGLLEGDWRREADGSDRSFLDGLVRWFVNRPWVLVVVFVLVLVTLFVSLLIIGPPGGRH
jgi:integral membrane protein